MDQVCSGCGKTFDDPLIFGSWFASYCPACKRDQRIEEGHRERHAELMAQEDRHHKSIVDLHEGQYDPHHVGSTSRATSTSHSGRELNDQTGAQALVMALTLLLWPYFGVLLAVSALNVFRIPHDFHQWPIFLLLVPVINLPILIGFFLWACVATGGGGAILITGALLVPPLFFAWLVSPGAEPKPRIEGLQSQHQRSIGSRTDASRMFVTPPVAPAQELSLKSRASRRQLPIRLRWILLGLIVGVIYWFWR